MRRTYKSAYSFLILSLLVRLSFGQAPTPDKKPVPSAVASNVHSADDVDIVRETQIRVGSKGYAGLVWWIPFEYWVQSMAESGQAADKTREQLKALRDYTIIGVFDGKVSQLGSVEYVTPSELQTHVVLRDSEGQDYPAIANLTGDAKSLADILRPLLANALGRAGENFALLFFPAVKKGGKRIADETSKGSFSVVLKEVVGEPETIYLWRTPLTSVAAPRYCPAGGERVRADWDYCPRHGVKLGTNP